MFTYAAKRILHAIPVLLGVVTITFVLMRVIPGDPVDSFVGQRVSAEQRQLIREQWHLEDPAWKQYIYYLKGIPTFDFGDSFLKNEPVRDELFRAFGHTAKLATAAMALAVVLGISIGLLSSVFKGTWIDRGAMLLALMGISTPVFWFGMILILIAASLNWPYLSGDGGSWHYLLLPSLTLGFRSVAYLARMTRSSVLEVMSKDFLMTARMKGVSEWNLIMKHVLKNALIPVVTIIGLDFASYLSGAVLTETVFSYPGIGTTILKAINHRDIPIIMGSVVFITFLFVFMNLIVDVLYGWLDPRIHYGGQEA